MTMQHQDTAQTQLIELGELRHTPSEGPALLNGHLRLLDSVPVTLAVTVGEIATTVGELVGLREATILKIDRAVDTPIDVILNGNVVARGQLVAVDDNFGIRITEVAANR